MSPALARRQAWAHGYTAVGHVTADILADGSRQPGGSAFYAALQAARLGHRALILTRGVPREIEELLAPYADELEVRVEPARRTTTLATEGAGLARRQRILAWAGPISAVHGVDTEVLHLAPVAREAPARWQGQAKLVGVTPQGLARRWRRLNSQFTLAAVGESELPRGCAAIVLSEIERSACAGLLRAGRRAGATVTITAGPDPITILEGAAEPVEVAVRGLEGHGEDLGAGDVFASVFFLELAAGALARSAAARAAAAAAVRIGGSGPGAVGDARAIARSLRASSGGS